MHRPGFSRGWTEMINLSEVGAHVGAAGKVRFGVFLPEITAAKNYSVEVRIIHELDQFTPEIPPKSFSLKFDPAHPLGLWSATVDLPANGGIPRELRNAWSLFLPLPSAPPRARRRTADNRDLTLHRPLRQGGWPGGLASFTIDDPASPTPPFSFEDGGFQVPSLDDMVVYELQVQEFYSTFDAVIPQLDYLAGLGVNVIELMPVTDFPQVFDWGYGPLHFFAPEDRWGGSDGLKRW